MTPPEYPRRPKFFALRFGRLMAKVCLANEIGADTCWLLSVIAHTEDAKGYRDAVTFFNGQLQNLVGCSSEDSFSRMRAKAIRSGWLHYEPGGKGRAGRYWVVVPNRNRDWDDMPTDEGALSDDANPSFNTADLRVQPRHNRERTARQARENRETSELSPALDPADSRVQPRENRETSEGEPRDKRGTSAEHSSLYLSLSQDPPSEVCTEPPKPADSEPPVLIFPTVGKGGAEWGLSPSKLAEYAASYPHLDVLTELRQACQWCRDNPPKRKTTGGMPAFCTRWLNSAVNDPRRSGARATVAAVADRPFQRPPDF